MLVEHGIHYDLAKELPDMIPQIELLELNGLEGSFPIIN